MQAQRLQKRFYKISALSMIAAGSVILLLSVWDMVKPRATCEYAVTTDGGNILTRYQSHCAPQMEIGQNSNNNFISVILSISLMAFGGAIIGMVTRYY